MILNFNEAEIKVEYEYKEYNKQGTEDDTSDDTIDTSDGEFKFKFNGIKLNSFNNDALPGYVYTSILDTLKKPKTSVLKRW